MRTSITSMELEFIMRDLVKSPILRNKWLVYYRAAALPIRALSRFYCSPSLNSEISSNRFEFSHSNRTVLLILFAPIIEWSYSPIWKNLTINWSLLSKVDLLATNILWNRRQLSKVNAPVESDNPNTSRCASYLLSFLMYCRQNQLFYSGLYHTLECLRVSTNILFICCFLGLENYLYYLRKSWNFELCLVGIANVLGLFLLIPSQSEDNPSPKLSRCWLKQLGGLYTGIANGCYSYLVLKHLATIGLFLAMLVVFGSCGQ